MGDENWTQRTSAAGEGVNPEVIKYLGLMAAQPKGIKSQRLPNGGRMNTDDKGVTFFSGGSYRFFEEMIQTLVLVCGSPTRDEPSTYPNSNEVEARSVHFNKGISIVYMAFRDSGISLFVPRDAIADLKNKLSDLQPVAPSL